MCKGLVRLIVIMRNSQHMTNRFAAPSTSIINALVRLYTILQICRTFICIHFISDQADLKLNTRFNRQQIKLTCSNI